MQLQSYYFFHKIHQQKQVVLVSSTVTCSTINYLEHSSFVFSDSFYTHEFYSKVTSIRQGFFFWLQNDGGMNSNWCISGGNHSQ
jgi:hypothetical protein